MIRLHGKRYRCLHRHRPTGFDVTATLSPSMKAFLSVCIVTLLAFPALTCAGPASYWSGVAEGLTSTHGETEISYRLFSAPDFTTLCSNISEPPKRLVALESSIVMHVGEWFPLRRLQIIALGESGNSLDSIPFAVTAEAMDPPLLDGSSEWSNSGNLLPVRPGSFRFRIRTLCSPPTVDLLIDAIIKSEKGSTDTG